MNYDEIRDGDMTNGYIPGYYIDDVKYTKSGDGTVPYASAIPQFSKEHRLKTEYI